MTVKELNECLTTFDYPERFKDIQPFIFEWEVVAGKNGRILVENDPNDPGGATFAGLDKRSHPNLDFRRITAKDVCSSYLAKYWNRFDCEHYSFPLGEAFYNCTVNCGVGRANKILANGVNTAGDFISAQSKFYEDLAATKPSLKRFLRGWENRLDALRAKLNLN